MIVEFVFTKGRLQNIDEVIFTKDFVKDHLITEYETKGFTKDEIPKHFKKILMWHVKGWNDISVQYRKSKGFINSIIN